MSNEWDEYAAEWDDDPAARAYAAAAHESLAELLGHAKVSLEGARVLDFGCGTGLLTERLVADGALVTAVDTSPAMLARVDEKIHRLGWQHVTTSDHIPGTDEMFELVVCSSVLSFVDDLAACVAQLSHTLRSGGWFVQWDWEQSGADEHGLTRAHIAEALTAAGLVDITVETAFRVDMHGQEMAPLRGSGRRPGTD